MKKLILLLMAVLLIGSLSACAEMERLFPWLPEFGTAAPAEDPLLGEDAPSQISGHPVVYDLDDMNLINHDLDGSDLLEHITLYTTAGTESAIVTIISDGAYYENWELQAGEGIIFVDAWSIELYYFSRRRETAAESVAWSFERDREDGYFIEDSVLTASPIRASADRQTAFLAVREELENGRVRVLLYLAQNVPDSNEVVLLDMVLFPGLWETQEEHNDAVLEAFSELIGIDLSVYLEEFAGRTIEI